MLLKLFGRPSHVQRNWLVLGSMPSTMVIGTLYISSGQRSLGRIPSWWIHALNFPRSPDLSSADSYAFTAIQVDCTTTVSLRVQSKSLPRVFTGFLDTKGIWTPPKEKWCLLDIPPFLKTKELDLARWKLILANVMSLSNLWSNQWHPGTADAVTVRSQHQQLHNIMLCFKLDFIRSHRLEFYCH